MDKKEITKLEIDNAQNYLFQIDKNFFENYQVFSEPVYQQTFSDDTDIPVFLKPRFEQCNFLSTELVGISGTNSIFDTCQLQNCNITNSNYKFSGFFSSSIKNSNIENSCFEDVIFEGTNLIKCEIKGCALTNSIISQSTLENLSISYCDFEGSLLKNVQLKNIDFSQNGFNYVEFDNVSIKNIIFPFADIFHCYNGLDLISEYDNDIILSFENGDTIISAKKCITLLDIFLPFFYSKNDFMAVSNIYIYRGEHEKAYWSIIDGLKNSLKRKDFKLIYNLCKLASCNSFFTRKQLRDFYELLQSDMVVAHLNTYEYKYYLAKMTEIKSLLIDNPFGRSQLVIEINTNILPDDYENLNFLIQKIDKIVDTQLPQANKYLSLRHNSPNVLEIFLSESLPNLILFIGYFSTILLGTTKIIKELQTIVKNHKEIEGIKLDNLIKKIELEKKELEMIDKDSKNAPCQKSNHIDKISYHIETNINIPADLRQNTYYRF